MRDPPRQRAEPTAPPTILATSLPAAGTIAATIPVGTEPQMLAFAAGSVWVPNSRNGTVSRMDLATNDVIGVIAIETCEGITAGSGSIWVSTVDQDPGLVLRIDP